MRDDLVELVRESAAEPLDMPDFDAMAVRGRRQRATTRILGVAAGVALLLVAGGVLWRSTSTGSPVIGDRPGPGATSTTTPSPRDTAMLQLPTLEELRAPYEPLFEGMPTPRGDGLLVATESRIEGLGAFVAPGQVLPLGQPAAVQDAPAGATFSVVVRDAETGDVVAEVTPDTPAGAGFEGPTTGPVGTRYVVEATLRDGGEVATWTDAAIVTDLTVDVDFALVGVARPGAQVEFVLVNRGLAGVVHGADYQLDRFVDGSWILVEDPPVNAMGYILGPASLSDARTTGALPGPGRYRLTTQVTYDQAGHDVPPASETVTLEFTTGE